MTKETALAPFNLAHPVDINDVQNVHRTVREQDTTENSNRREIDAATQRMTSQISQYIQHTASAGLESPLHTCSGGGII